MGTYTITAPITGILYAEVEANSEEEAKEKFYQADLSLYDVEEWEMHERIVSGNVFHGMLNEMEIEEI